MGDRANVLVKDRFNDESKGENGVYLYTHNGGTELPETVRIALAKRWRWQDGAYLARIIFDVMTEGCHGKETGFGIGSYMPDDEYGGPIVVDTKTQTVAFRGRTWTFEEYIAQREAVWPERPRRQEA